MAIQHPGLKRVGAYWHFELRINGQRVHGSTRATDLATARKVLEERRRQVLLGQCGAPKVPTLSSLVVEWLQAHKGVHSKKHWEDVERVSRNWLLPAIGSKRLDHITSEDVAKLRSKMLELGRSLVTTNDVLKILKLLCRYGIKHRYIRELPFKVEFLRVQRKPRPTVPAAKVREFLATVDRGTRNPQIRVMIRVMVGLGLRESEVLGMRWEWFDPERKTYTVGKAKGKEARVLPVPDWLWQSVRAMPKTSSEWVFPAKDGGPHYSQFCKKTLQRVCETLKLGKVTQHRLRATFASIHAAVGTPLAEIQEMLGHKDISTTMIYVETNLEAKRKAQNVFGKKLRLA